MASSSSTSHSKWSYDVFLSFRGEDTRRNFTDHLYKALIHSGFRTFRDDEEIRRGEEIAQELLTAIEESRSAIIVFSKTYAHSKWCLEELVKIMKCKEEREQMVVIPIFYHVDPSEVRNQTGIYGEAFTHHEENADEERKEKIRKWKTALRQASNLAGYDATNRYESELIDEIIENVSRSFPKTLDVNENIVGMDSRLERLISLLKIELNDVRMVGVYGLGGIGKTTIINALYNQISNQFKSVSLLTDVRKESTENSGLLKLQQQLLNDTLRTTKKIVLRNVHEGIKEIRDKLSSKKVLVFLDDVDELTQLEHLIGKHNWFGPGSRIIITTRKKDLLTRHGVNDMYEVEKLNFHEALQLFCRYAFKQHHPKVGSGDLSHQVVRYADGLPLALKVLGSLLFGKGLPDWKSELRKLEKVPNMEIVKVLKISFDGLDYTQRMIFLDIACFFKGDDVKLVSRVLDGSGLEAESGINALVDRCFITISKDNRIDMHDLLAQMGKGIVDEECPNEPGERSRLWRHTDIYRVLKRNTCLRNLRYIDLSDSQQLIELPNFSNMPYLEELILSGCVSLESLPGDIHQLKLLLILDCSGCSKLTSFPKINCNIGKLEQLSLDETAIKELPSSIELLEGLRDLYLGNCKNLEGLPNSICNLRFLVVLSLEGCSKLDRLPEDLERMPCLEFLSLNSLSCQLPSLSGLSLLRELYLDQCNLTPGVIKSDNCLNALKELSLRNCNLNGGVFHCIFHLSSLEVLNLSRCNPEEGGTLSDILVGISQLSNLRALDLSHCKKLSQIPELPSSLRLLDMHSSVGTSLPPMHSLVNCLKSANQDLKHESNSNGVFLADSHYIGHGICIVVPGSSGIPKWIRNQREGCQITMDLPQNCYENNDFLGIAICCVYAPLPENDFADTSKNESGDEALDEYDDLLEAESSISTELKCQLSLSEVHGFSFLRLRHLSFRTTCKCYHDGGVSEQVWVIFYPKAAILESCHTNRFMHLNAAFMGSRNHFKVLKCGLQPIYSQDPIVQTEDVDASCLECQRNVEHRKLCLKGQTISLLPIERASEFDTLCLRECKNLESLPTSIWEFKSINSLFCSHCSQLQYFPEILENMENLRVLHLNKTAIKELPSSIKHLNRLEVLNLDGCENLVTLPESICDLCFLEVLDVGYCSKLHKLPQNLGRLQSLKCLRASGLNSTCCQLLSLSGLCSLKELILFNSKLMQGVVLSDICCLYSLEVLDLSFCGIDEGGIPTEIRHLSSLQKLLLIGNLFRSIPSGVSQLSMLRLLDLGHCQELRQIPALPSSLRVLDVQECTRLETSSGLLWSSLFNCFKSVIQDCECKIYHREKRFTRVNLIISVSCGMPKWISHRKKGATVAAKLPQNWYKNNDLLGFVLYCVYDPLDNESEETLENDATYFQYGLTLRGHEIQFVDELQFYPSYHCYDVVPKMWMTYYPKVEIVKNYPSNKWRQLTASFCGFSRGKAMKVEECGIHLIYAHDHEKNNGKAMTPTICRECQEDVQSRRKLCLKRNAINELPTIECPLELDRLCLRECKNLEHLPSSICELKSLTTLFCSGCSRLRSFPEILEDVENLRELHLDGTAIEELPASIQFVRGLQYLSLSGCSNLVSLPESICNLSSLKFLNVSFCTKLEKFPENLRSLQCLEGLHASGLNLSMDCFSSILAGIIQLSKLRVLELSHCQGLLQVPELPPSLRVLDVHSCTCLESLSSPSSLLGVSLFKCFKSTIEEFECGSYWDKAIRVVISGNNGIPEWISQQKKGSQITIELPMDWYRKDDFLGFALYSVFIPMACNELNCELNICGDQSECCHVDDVWFYCCRICGESSQMCVTYYPKVAIDNQYWSNEWRRLKASFDSLDAPVEVKECGYYLIYTGDVINRNIPEDTSTDAQRSCDNTEATKRDHQAMIEYNNEQRSCDTRSAAEDTNSNTQTSYDCTQCTECSDSPMDTTTQNINSNVVDAQDDEEDQMHNWLELLCKFVGWICCRRY
ncbi:disease resistance protein RPV1-like isoform X2 [Vitis riparia]|uniref:disease resistance protein RPV1-like isoform X2 n=1 Tax=Vitis riparia TaxID=96939 RepID=UPI00155A9A04|nr:disease resistance protein RPV1-like isoform X2 [Vitis riparia]